MFARSIVNAYALPLGYDPDELVLVAVDLETAGLLRRSRPRVSPTGVGAGADGRSIEGAVPVSPDATTWLSLSMGINPGLERTWR